MKNEIIAQVIELREYSEFSVFQIASRMGLSLGEVEFCLAKYKDRPKQDMVLQSRVNLCPRSWFIFENRNILSNIEMAKQLGIAEVTVRKAIKDLGKKKHIFLANNNAEVRARILCLNLETGIYYRSVTEAVLTIPHWSHIHAYNMIVGHKKNKTPIEVV